MRHAGTGKGAGGGGGGRGEREKWVFREGFLEEGTPKGRGSALGQLGTKLTCPSEKRWKGKSRKREGQVSGIWSYVVCVQTKASLR